MTTDTRILILSQEQDAQGETIADLRRRLNRAERAVRHLEQEVATLKAAWVASKTEGAGCSDCNSK